MNVLLTGATGFVGSHILDSLVSQGISATLLLRHSSRTQFVDAHLKSVQVRIGSLFEPESLRQAMKGISHVIHCAGATKAMRVSEFYQINQAGTRNVIDAINAQNGKVRRMVLISSLAAAGPSAPNRPRREEDPPQPVSAYGKSKLAAELEVRDHCLSECVILRPSAVYGPRDKEFLMLFKAVRGHLLPMPSPRQAFSAVFARDLAQVAVSCLNHPAAAGRTYYVSGPEVLSAGRMGQEIAAQMKARVFRVPLPRALLWSVCLAQELMSRLTREPAMLSLKKWPELRACGWVCDSSLLEREIGRGCPTTLERGVEETLEWYRQNHWL